MNCGQIVAYDSTTKNGLIRDCTSNVVYPFVQDVPGLNAGDCATFGVSQGTAVNVAKTDCTNCPDC
jgi:hypothetical protein